MPSFAVGTPAPRWESLQTLLLLNYSFSELITASAKTRQEVLQRLVPKLKIGNRCSFAGRFLVVKGNLRTYNVDFVS